MEKFIGQDIEDLHERELFIKDNAECIETMGYSKPLAGSEIDKLKEQLTDACIKKQDLEEEKKTVVKGYSDDISEQKAIIKDCSEKLKSKSEYVMEPCYKLIDEDEKMAGYYNKEGMLVYERPARTEELQPRLFKMNATKPTGTDDK
jgi:hypothetical protein